MGLELTYGSGQTPLHEEEKESLLVPTISTRAELDEFEQYNIEKAVEWTVSEKFDSDRLLSVQFIRELHFRMFSKVWDWAGSFRRTNKKLGVDWHEIPEKLQQLLADARYWMEHEVFPPDELVIRFKHRLLSIHCFPDGNGRHARLLADTYIDHIYGKEVFSWGQTGLFEKSKTRDQYIKSLKQADHWNIEPLLAFARS